MGAGFVHLISEKKHKITTLTTIKKLLTTPLNTGLLPKKMGLNFIFKIHIFSKIRCGVKEWELKSNKKRILEYLIKDSKFINALINEVGDYVEGDPVSCFIKLKEKA